MPKSRRAFLDAAAERVASLARVDVPDDEPRKDEYFEAAVQFAAERLMRGGEAEYEGLARPLTGTEADAVIGLALAIGRVPRRSWR